MSDIKKWKVAIRGGFSDREGIKPINTEIQTKSLDDRSRIAIINVFNTAYAEVFEGYTRLEKKSVFWNNVISEVYQNETVDLNYIYNHESELLNTVKNTIRKDDYDSVLSICEYLIRNLSVNDVYSRVDVVKLFNHAFETEYIGYRYIEGYLVSITDQLEIDSIQRTMKGPYEKVSIHINKALKLLSDRNQPDYENSIKESISAVEEMCNQLTGEKGSLGNTLNKLTTNGIEIHPALKEAFNKLYGYTSDAAGIRHAGQLGGAQATFAEAQFMIVSCSSFINYLKIVSCSNH